MGEARTEREQMTKDIEPDLTGHDATGLVKLVSDLAHIEGQDDVARLVREAARSLSRADGVAFVLRDGGDLHFVDDDAIGPTRSGQRVQSPTCVAGWVIENASAASIVDVSSDPRVPHRAYAGTFVKSLAMVPIGKSDPLGALGAYWKTQHEATSRELALLQAIADGACAALTHIECLAREKGAREQAEEETRLRSELLGVVSHDLRSPLSSIAMSASLLAPLIAPLNGRARHHLELIARSARRIDGLIHDLLDFSTIKSGRLRVDLRVASVQEILGHVIDFIPLAQERGVRLDFDTDLQSTLVVADVDRLHQVFSNLIGNALKFTPAGGTIRVAVQVEQNAVRFSVADSGTGFSSKDLAHALPDARAPHKTAAQGFGLGLAITHGIVEAHGGSIRLDNAPGGGALVTFSLPRTRASAVAVPAE